MDAQIPTSEIGERYYECDETAPPVCCSNTLVIPWTDGMRMSAPVGRGQLYPAQNLRQMWANRRRAADTSGKRMDRADPFHLYGGWHGNWCLHDVRPDRRAGVPLSRPHPRGMAGENRIHCLRPRCTGKDAHRLRGRAISWKMILLRCTEPSWEPIPMSR